MTWSSEQTSCRLKHESSQFSISYNTIYRAIYSNNLRIKLKNRSFKGIVRKLRHRGKTRHSASHIETRGEIKIFNTIYDRPENANKRNRIGDWKADTVIEKLGHSGIVTLVDRRSRYLLTAKVPKKISIKAISMMIRLLSKLPSSHILTAITDREKYAILTNVLNVPIYFLDAHAPW
ncbi:IS30 family transposase [Dellaglioa sp. L3N]